MGSHSVREPIFTVDNNGPSSLTTEIVPYDFEFPSVKWNYVLTTKLESGYVKFYNDLISIGL